MTESLPPAAGETPHPSKFQSRFLLPRYWPTWLGLGLLAASRYLPARPRAGLGAALGELYFRLSVKRRRIAQINIDLCFPHWSADARRQLVHRHFRAFAQSMLDLGWLWWGRPASLDARVRIIGYEHYTAQRAQGKNVILLTCHSTAIEVGGAVLSRHSPHVALIKPSKNALINWFWTRARRRFGGRVFLRSQTLRPVARAIKQGVTFYYLPDEDLGLTDAVFAPFFGVPAATLTALGRLARLCDAVVLPCFTHLLPHGQGYEVRLGPPLEQFPNDDPVVDAIRMNREIEQGLQSMPEQYMWTYKRFKTRPDGGASPYE